MSRLNPVAAGCASAVGYLLGYLSWVAVIALGQFAAGYQWRDTGKHNPFAWAFLVCVVIWASRAARASRERKARG